MDDNVTAYQNIAASVKASAKWAAACYHLVSINAASTMRVSYHVASTGSRSDSVNADRRKLEISENKGGIAKGDIGGVAA